MTDAEAQLASFFAKYGPVTAALGKALRARLRSRLPGLSEVVYVYEGRDSLVISYSPTGKGYDGVCSMALYPDRVQLYFAKGALLSKADPDGLLQGRGGTVRHIVLHSVADFDRPGIEVLMAAALQLANLRPDANAEGPVIFRVEAQKRRARRAAKAARPAAARRKAKARR